MEKERKWIYNRQSPTSLPQMHVLSVFWHFCACPEIAFSPLVGLVPPVLLLTTKICDVKAPFPVSLERP